MPRVNTASTEIDDIFASKSSTGLDISSLTSKGKGKAKAMEEGARAGAVAKKKKKKKDKIAQAQTSSHVTDLVDNSSSLSSGKRKKPEPETVVDPSTSLSVPTKRLKTAGNSGLAGKEKSKKKVDGEARFRDSRGTGPRRKTEDGFLIYKEDELGIRDEGGDTPLCPFDCDCCF